ncbi:surface lipoprotein assembly modifier [Parasphingorhabdus sp.]|uniref:surface lipoprotein assembly modifier n=1 Tax=Parasphingorhabdus sp. TaxID=2709688 RepID=UPI003A8E7878
MAASEAQHNDRSNLSEDTASLDVAELFAFADNARDSGDYDTAETAYRALATNPELELRTEARFRLALMLEQQKRPTDAAVLLRQILDEKPDAARVRLELARMLALMGDLSGAARELRQAQATGLPSEVARLVNIYTSALRSQKPFGASVEIALAPDSNINRATESTTLDTIIAQFDLSEDAQAKSGIGLSLKGQAYARAGIDKRSSLLVRLSADGDLYQEGQFNDISLGLQAGPEMRSGKDRIRPSAGYSYRWYGGTPYADTISAAINIQHPMGNRAQMSFNGSIGYSNNRRNDLQDGETFAAALSYERALSAKAGASLTISGIRQSLKDPGYSTASGAISALVYREFGKTTLVGLLGYGHLEADERLFLFPRRRTDNRYNGSISGTFRQFSYKGFAPLLRVSYERSKSTVELYDYSRVASEIGITRAF